MATSTSCLHLGELSAIKFQYWFSGIIFASMPCQYLFFSSMVVVILFPKCSGDQDSVVPLLGSRTLVRELAHDMKLKTTVPYGAWFHKGQVHIVFFSTFPDH